MTAVTRIGENAGAPGNSDVHSRRPL